MTRIAINGFGRIGRAVLRLLLTRRDGFELVMINDIAPLDTCAYLFQYDSVFGPYPGRIEAGDGVLLIDGTPVTFHCRDDISTLDLRDVDVVLECTGLAGHRGFAQRGIDAGAGAVLVSGPSKTADTTVVLGANDEVLNGQKIVSNASCTTNALAPLMKLLDDAFGIESGQMVTVHCYTGSQPTVDMPRANPARSRAAALSMVPTTTSAAHLINEVLPDLAGKVEARALRVPTASVSCIDLTVSLRDRVTAEQVNALIRDRSDHVLGWTHDPVVSTDMRMRPESIVMALPETSVSNTGLLRVFGWYDNEWGFANRLLDVARIMTT